MKRMSSAPSPFGMAALDLFASALGAFILIAVVIFPMIGKAVPDIPAPPAPIIMAMPAPDPVPCPVCPTCPVVAAVTEPIACPVCPACPVPEPTPVTICPEVAAPDPVECPVCPPVPAQVICPVCPPAPPPVICPEPAPAPIQVDAPHFRFPHLDIIVALDITNSMSGQVANLKAEVEQLAVLLNRISPSFGIGMVAFGDRRWESPLYLFPLRELSGPAANRDAFRTFVNGLSVGMGTGRGSNPDSPEAFYDALSAASQMTWRPRSERRVVVMVTDNPAYSDEIDRSISGRDRHRPARRPPRLHGLRQDGEREPTRHRGVSPERRRGRRRPVRAGRGRLADGQPASVPVLTGRAGYPRSGPGSSCSRFDKFPRQYWPILFRAPSSFPRMTCIANISTADCRSASRVV